MPIETKCPIIDIRPVGHFVPCHRAVWNRATVGLPNLEAAY